MSTHIDIVFDGPPAAESGRFMEVENAQRASVRFGEWVQRDDGYWVLRITPDEATLRALGMEPIEGYAFPPGATTGWIDGAGS